MRALLLSLTLLAGSALAGCYSTGDLGPQPFRCSKDHPECPEGYACVAPATTSPGKPSACNSSGRDATCLCAIPCKSNDDCSITSSAICCSKTAVCDYQNLCR